MHVVVLLVGLVSRPRYHNMLARKLKAIHGDWSDETCFQEARKIAIAVFQHITYTQFMDALLGVPNEVSVTETKGKHVAFYDPTQDASISMGRAYENSKSSWSMLSNASQALVRLPSGSIHT